MELIKKLAQIESFKDAISFIGLAPTNRVESVNLNTIENI